MMRGLTWMLLAANLVLAAYVAGVTLWPKPLPADQAALNVERLFLRGPAAPAVAPSPRPAARAAETFCIEWRGLAADELVRVREQLKALTADRVMSFVETPLETRRWVIFPPLPSAQSAAAKLAELNAAGVTDAFVVKDGDWRNAISLGLYANDEAARRRVRQVEARGVFGTRVEAVARQGTAFYFIIRSDDPDALKALGEIRQAYPNSQQTRVACP